MRLGRDVIHAARSMLSDLQLSHKHCPDIIPVIQSALNNTRSRHHGNYSSLTSFTDIQSTTLIQNFPRSDTGKSVSVSDNIDQDWIAVENVQKTGSDMHPVIANTLEEYRKQSRDAVERGQLAHFSGGDPSLLVIHFTAAKKVCLR